MSFKRDKDDKCALENLRKRRITDLLYEDIEDGEVTQLRSGKYTCKMCSNCPVFDTINMYHVHKQGKKHQQSLLYKERQKKELQDLIDKRRHENYVKTGNIDLQCTQQSNQSSSHDYGRSLPYDPRAKKNKPKPFDRKPIVDLNNTAASSSQNCIEASLPEMLPGNRLSNGCHGNQTFDKSLCDQKTKPSMKNEDFKYNRVPTTGIKTISNSLSQSDKISNQDSNNDSYAKRKPSAESKSTLISSKRKDTSVNSNTDDKIVNPNSIQKLISKATGENNSKHYFERRQQNKNSFGGFGIVQRKTDLPITSVATEHHVTKSWEFYKDRKTSRAIMTASKSQKLTENKTKTTENSTSGTCSHKLETGPESVSNETVLTKSTDITATEVVKERKEIKKDTAQKFLQAVGSGWKRDWDGQWVKDVEAEFDSDEEPPVVV